MAEKLAAAAVILNHNDDENTRRLLKTFDEYKVVGRVIVVDNTGKGGLEGACSPKLSLLCTANNGYASGNNAGIELLEKTGGAQFIIISNPDVFVDEDAITACVEFLRQHEDYAIAAPRMFSADGKPHHLSAWRERTFLCDFAYSSGILSRIVGMRRECYPDSYWTTEFSEVDCVAGSFFIIRADMFRQAGYFDQHTFLYYEEDILGFKLKRLGYKSAILNSCHFLHCEGASVNRSMNFLRKYIIMQKSRLYFHRCYKKTGFLRYSALCAATALGVVEKSVKTMIYRFCKPKSH